MLSYWGGRNELLWERTIGEVHRVIVANARKVLTSYTKVIARTTRSMPDAGTAWSTGRQPALPDSAPQCSSTGPSSPGARSRNARVAARTQLVN